MGECIIARRGGGSSNIIKLKASANTSGQFGVRFSVPIDNIPLQSSGLRFRVITIPSGGDWVCADVFQVESNSSYYADGFITSPRNTKYPVSSGGTVNGDTVTFYFTISYNTPSPTSEVRACYGFLA